MTKSGDAVTERGGESKKEIKRKIGKGLSPLAGRRGDPGSWGGGW